METLFFHPKVVHIPMALGVLMPLIAGGFLLAWWRKWLPMKAWWAAVGLQAVLLASGIVALRSGQAEEDTVERVVAEAAIEQHEEAAEAFVWGSGAVLLIMFGAATLGMRREGLPLAAVSTLGTLVVLFLGYRTGQAGGKLVYEQGAASAYVAKNASGSVRAAGQGISQRRQEGDDD